MFLNWLKFALSDFTDPISLSDNERIMYLWDAGKNVSHILILVCFISRFPCAFNQGLASSIPFKLELPQEIRLLSAEL